ncbi:MAG: beta-lactamase family protein, partial [Bacteroidetes bacterium]|nr:beta-lactamase family protein [Bacteroidota bacterium]
LLVSLHSAGEIRASVSASSLFENLSFRIQARSKEEQYSDFFNKLSKKQGFNGVVLIAENHRIVFHKAYGYANLRNKTNLHQDDVFQLASVSKQFTAIAVMMLHEKGYLDYDDPLTCFIPEFPYPEITIRHLLTHRSGLPEYRWFLDSVLPDKSLPVSNSDLLRYITRLKPGLNFKPGSRFLYSNTGYAMLASLIERISGMSFQSFMKLAVFKPLGMKNTQVYSKCDKAGQPGRVKGYERNGRETPDNDGFNGITGDKNIYSCTSDLFIWDQALYSDKLISQETLQEAFREGSPRRASHRNYGFGWRLNFKNPDKKIVYHGGWWDGFRTLFLRNMSDGNTLIVLSNKVNHSINSLHEIREELCGGECDS